MGSLTVDTQVMADTTSSNIPTPSVETPIILYRRRWVILAIFSLVSMMNEVVWISLSSVANIVQNYYQVTYTSINWLAMIFSCMTVTTVLSVYILNKYGLKVTIVTGALCTFLATVLRLIGYKRNGFMFAFIGNIIGGIGQSFLIFITPTISAIWFGEKERARATSIGTLMNMLGIAFGFLMGSLLIPNSNDYNGVVKDGMFTILLTQAVVCGILLILSVLFIKKCPPTPSSNSQVINTKRKEAKREMAAQSKSGNIPEEKVSTYATNPSEIEDGFTQSTGFFKNWKMLKTNLNFHLLTQAYSLYFGMFVTVATLLNQMTISHFPGKEKLIGIMGFTSILCGVISIMLTGIWIDKTHRYKFLSICIFISCIVSCILFTVVLKYSGNFIITFVAFSLYGFCSYPYLSVGFEYIAEVMYPIKESILAFILVSVGTIYGIVFTSIIGVIIDKAGAEIAGYIIAGLYFIGLICAIQEKGELKRLKVDMKNIVINNEYAVSA